MKLFQKLNSAPRLFQKTINSPDLLRKVDNSVQRIAHGFSSVANQNGLNAVGDLARNVASRVHQARNSIEKARSLPIGNITSQNYK